DLRRLRGPRLVPILLDEHISPDVAQWLTADGHTVTCLRDRGLLRQHDWQIFKWCQDNGYAVCTKNGADFRKEHERSLRRGDPHRGILVVGEWSTSEVYQALKQFLASLTPQLAANRGPVGVRLSHHRPRPGGWQRTRAAAGCGRAASARLGPAPR